MAKKDLCKFTLCKGFMDPLPPSLPFLLSACAPGPAMTPTSCKQIPEELSFPNWQQRNPGMFSVEKISTVSGLYCFWLVDSVAQAHHQVLGLLAFLLFINCFLGFLPVFFFFFPMMEGENLTL